MRISRVGLVISLVLVSLTGWTQTLRLPFFDDFSTSPLTPSPARWVGGSGVYINNTLTTDHPSVNIATFDGLRANGLPYDLSNENAEGGTDTLTSLPIDLGGLSVRDSVYISFFWQRRGLGELPDAADSLALEFLGSDGRWQKVWGESGGVVNNNYTQQLVRTDNALFFHPAFRFRFRSRGRQSGAFDQWHLDYIYMNRGRTRFDRFVRDLAIRRPVSPLLRRYSAMPLRQFLAKAATELADTVSSDARNLFNDPAGFNQLNFRFTLRNQQTGTVFQSDTLANSLSVPSLGAQAVTWRRPTVITSDLSGRAVLQAQFRLLTNVSAADPVDFRLNDTLSNVTVLDNYYAYDDGSAEIATQINQRLARVAVRFVNNLPDAVKGVRIYIAPTRRNQENQQIAFSIFNDAGNNSPATRQLMQQTFPIKYAAVRNGFVDYLFTNPVNVRDTFYVAYAQLDDPPIPIGFDRNSPFRNNTFINLGTRWDAVTGPEGAGALMIRPIMNNGPADVLTATEPETPVQVFPNPSTGGVNWGGSLAGSVRLEVTDLSGRTWLAMPLAPTQTRADLGQLPDGFYLLRFTNEAERTRTVKWIIRH